MQHSHTLPSSWCPALEPGLSSPVDTLLQLLTGCARVPPTCHLYAASSSCRLPHVCMHLCVWIVPSHSHRVIPSLPAVARTARRWALKRSAVAAPQLHRSCSKFRRIKTGS